MRLTALLFALSTVLLASTCRTDSKTAFQQQQLNLLTRTWLHAHEEDQGDVRVYRPNTYNFPPSRGRTGFMFEQNGLFTQYDIAPTDGVEGRKGLWSVVDEHTVRVSLSDKKDPDYQLEIVSLDEKMLKVRQK
ncbi:hypothetical protein EJV47_11510 [Hymenobacter gummosus]|uniref:Lipocalin-like domain-containing protein n=1 Tax=Hymenobacter gummosus TaxID=1776032 RepID=A0A3S0JES1_9BACT|nr:hypothetical protein [Hymenobacter gummosus]RTQ50247.1 hypothetical protein EJV47_11510 [Hymenobacter gummosus]